MPNQEEIATWVTRPLKTGELIFVKGIRADDLPEGDKCAICHVAYGAPNEDVSPEHAVRFPCGHTFGDTCFQTWLDSVSPEPRCMICNKSLIPAQFLLEQVEEIWSIVSTMSPKAWRSYTPGGPPCQAIGTLKRYIDEGRSLSFETPYKVLVPSCVSLLTAAYSFGHALMRHIQLEKAVTNRHDQHLEDFGNAKWAFEDSYYSYRRMSEGMVVDWANEWDIQNPPCVKSLRSKPRRVTTDIFFLLSWTSVILGLLCMEIEIIKKVLSSHRPMGYLECGNWVEGGSCTNIVLCCGFWMLFLLVTTHVGTAGVGFFLVRHRPTYLLGRELLDICDFKVVRDRYERVFLLL